MRDRGCEAAGRDVGGLIDEASILGDVVKVNVE